MILPETLKSLDIKYCELLPPFNNSKQLKNLKFSTCFKYGVKSFIFPPQLKSLSIYIPFTTKKINSDDSNSDSNFNSNFNPNPNPNANVPLDIFSLHFPPHLEKLNLDL